MELNLWPNFRGEEFENISQSFSKVQPGSIVVKCSLQVPWVTGSNLDKVWLVLCGQKYQAQLPLVVGIRISDPLLVG